MVPPSPRCLAAACGAGGCLRCSRPLRLSHSRMFAVQLCRGRVEVPVRVSKASSHFVLGISPHARPLCKSFPQCVSVKRRQVLLLLHPLELGLGNLLLLEPFLLHPSPVFRRCRKRALQLQMLSNTKVSLPPKVCLPSEARSSSFSAHILCCELWFVVCGLGFRVSLFHIYPPPSLSDPPPKGIRHSPKAFRF